VLLRRSQLHKQRKGGTFGPSRLTSLSFPFYVFFGICFPPLKSLGEIQRVSELVTVPTRQCPLDHATSTNLGAKRDLILLPSGSVWNARKISCSLHFPCEIELISMILSRSKHDLNLPEITRESKRRAWNEYD